MAAAKIDMDADYAALRRDLTEVLSEQLARGRFAWMTKSLDQTGTARVLSDLARAIADILLTALPKRGAITHAAVMADAAVLARDVLIATSSRQVRGCTGRNTFPSR